MIKTTSSVVGTWVTNLSDKFSCPPLPLKNKIQKSFDLVLVPTVSQNVRYKKKKKAMHALFTLRTLFHSMIDKAVVKPCHPHATIECPQGQAKN